MVPTPSPVKGRPISTVESFICGGIAACIAVRQFRKRSLTRQLIGLLQVTVSNPFEVAKTRLQLQGELAKGGGIKVYNNAADVLAKTWRNEGIRGLQRGLSPAVSLLCSIETCFNIRKKLVCISGRAVLLHEVFRFNIQTF
jgi:solute carrier family 25 protein 34/35